MRKFASIAIVVVLLLAAAFYYGNLKKDAPVPTPDVTPDVKPDVRPVANLGEPVVHAVADGTLKLTAAISHGYILAAQPGEMYATVGVKAIEYKGAERAALNVSIVVDRSGSMAGEKMEQVKEAARQMVNLLGDKDRVSIVSYGSDVTVEFPAQLATPANRAEMINVINRIEVSGGTNLSGGYERGLAEVQRWKTPTSINRVLLMSDGNANIGVTYLPDLKRMASQALSSGVSLSTIGVGLDYNEDLMAQMANEGAGNYYFVDTQAAIAQAFEKELKGLSATVARNTSLILELPDNVELGALYGFPYKQVGSKLMIPLAEFHSLQEKDVLLKLVPKAGQEGVRPILTAQLAYNDTTQDDRALAQSVALRAVASNDANKVNEQVNGEVIARVQQIEVATTMQQAMDMYNRGETRGAIKMLEAQQAKMDEVSRRYKMAPSKQAAFGRVRQEIDVMNAAMQAAPAESDQGRRMVKEKKARSHSIMLMGNAF
jgi:Ca-activated chloride channel family protein